MYWFSGPFILQLVYLSGLSTSVWNHGTTNIVALWSDGLMMAIGWGIDLYFYFMIFILCFILCTYDFYFMYMYIFILLPWDEGAVVFFLVIASVSCYFCAKVISGFKTPLGKEGRALTMKELDLIPSLFHMLAHVFVSMAHVLMLYWCAHGSSDSIVGVGGTENIFNYQHSIAAGIASLTSYFIHVISKIESMKDSDFSDHYNLSRVRN